jgi:hypothetical protein
MLAILIVTGSMGAAGFAAGGASGRTADSDNDFASANTLKSGVLTTGDVNDTDDPSDYYKISGLSGQTLTVNFSYTCSSNFLVLNIYDGNQNLLGTSYGSFVLFIVLNSSYYIEVNTWSGSDFYDLTATVDYPPTLTPGVQVKTHLDDTDGLQSVRYYRIWLSGNVSGKSEAVWVNMTEPAGTDFDLYAMDILNARKSETYNLTWYGDPSERITFAASYTGWYYVRADGFQGAGDITLDVTKFTVASDGDNDNVNGTKARHNAVINNTVDQGWDHYDWYKYHVFAGDTLTVKVDKTSGTDVFNLSIYKPDMTYIDGNWNVQNGQVTASASVTLAAAQAETTYLVSVSALLAVRQGQQTDDTAYIPYKITYTSTNHYPAVVSSFDDITTDEDTPVSVPVAAHFSEPDGDALSFTSTGATNIAVAYNASSGNLDITPAANWHGAETVTVTADDGFGGKTSLTINVTVKDVNDAPFVKKRISDIKMLQGGTDASVDLSKVFSDNDLSWGDTLTYAVENNGSLRVTIAADGKVTIVDPIEYYGIVSMRFTATDGAGAQAVAQCNVTVQHVNQPPRVKSHPGNVTVDEDKTATLDMSQTFSDLDGDPITLIASGQTRITVSIDPNTNIVTFKPSPNLSGFFEDIKFTAQDDKGYGDFFVVVRVTVAVVNDPPVIKSASPSGEVTLTETEGQEFSVTVTTVESWDTFNYTWYLDDKDLLWNEPAYPLTTDYNSAGKHVLKLVVDDGTDSATRIWNITVLNKNREPTDVKITVPKSGESFMQATEVEFSGSGKDPDGDQITYSWMDGRTELSTEKSFTTKTLRPGSHTIVLEVSDGTATVKSKQVTVIINPNTPPRIITLVPASGQDFTTGKRIEFSVSARDAEGDPLTYQWSEAGRVLSTQPVFSVSNLKEGTHNIQLSIYDGFSYTNQTIVVEVVAPVQAQAVSGRMMYYLLGAVALIAVIAAVAVLVMRRRKPKEPEPAPPQPMDGAAAAAALYGGQPQDYQAPPSPSYDYGAYQQPAADQPPAEQQYDASQYTPEYGMSDAQPGGDASRPAWASSPARLPITAEEQAQTPGTGVHVAQEPAAGDAPAQEPAPPAPEVPPASPEPATADQPPAETEKKE